MKGTVIGIEKRRKQEASEAQEMLLKQQPMMSSTVGTGSVRKKFQLQRDDGRSTALSARVEEGGLDAVDRFLEEDGFCWFWKIDEVATIEQVGVMSEGVVVELPLSLYDIVLFTAKEGFPSLVNQARGAMDGIGHTIYFIPCPRDRYLHLSKSYTNEEHIKVSKRVLKTVV
jgi:hypothetical protein